MDARKAGTGHSFAWLNATQFLGALNDNVFKLFLVYLVIAVRGEESAATAGVIGMVLLATPFLLFSAAAGVIADRVSKRKIIVLAKAAEVAAMAAGAIAFYFKAEVLLFVIMFLMAAQSAFFGPAKYGIIPELVGRERLSRANAWIQALTNLAIIFGTVLAPFLSNLTGGNYFRASLVCVGVAMVGLVVALPIRHTEPAGAERRISWFFLGDIWRTLCRIRRDGYLLMAVLASAYFMLLGAFMHINLIPYALEELGLTKEAGTYIFLLAAVGIATGSILAGRMSGRNVELGIVPIGAAGLAIGALALGNGSDYVGRTCFWVFVMGASAGLFVVPVNSWIQFRSPRKELGEILAASGFLSWVGVILAAGLIHLLSNVIGLSAREGFLVMGWMTLLLTVITLRVLPDFFVRFIGVLITRFCYRLRVRGIENVPVEGAALLVCNHVSWADAMLLAATQQRRIRFLAAREVYEKPFLKPFLKICGVIPVSFKGGPKSIVASLGAARAAMDEGYMVCIFAEGALTRSGNLLAFKSGFERIVKNSDYPVIPVYLGGAWGSILSYAHGKPMSRWPVSFPYPVTILFGEPLPATVSATELREKVMELSCAYFDDRKPKRRPMGADFVRTARNNWGRPAAADTTGRNLSYGETLTGAVALREVLKPMTAGQKMVGVLLPPSVAGVLSNLAVTMLGKVPVNLNYTASAEAFISSIDQCGLTTVLTSRIFLDKLEKLPVPEGAVYVEDIFARITMNDKRKAFLKARFLPWPFLVDGKGFTADSLGTVIFSSGSTGEPKGVMLSHHNILSNIESLRIVFHPAPDDVVCAVLPFFHSFGFMATMWFPLLSGFSAVYHSNPLDGARVAQIVREHKATILFATPTFLLSYMRRAKPEDFSSLALIVCGAEKLKTRIADAFEEKFGVRPYEGYGATELAPVAALNIPNVRLGGMEQVGVKEGSVGHPVPGVAVKIIDPDSGERLSTGEGGLMWVKGPNVMLGYLGQPERTAEVLKDGWYNTGDIARMDEDGFITITDRLSRFSKIGGEMVPHIGVEEALHKALGRSDQVLAVAAVPDEKKGEKLVVLYTQGAVSAEDVQKAIAGSDLPNLWKPSAGSVLEVDELPLLGSGKLDLKALKKLAIDLTGGAA